MDFTCPFKLARFARPPKLGTCAPPLRCVLRRLLLASGRLARLVRAYRIVFPLSLVLFSTLPILVVLTCRRRTCVRVKGARLGQKRHAPQKGAVFFFSFFSALSTPNNVMGMMNSVGDSSITPIINIELNLFVLCPVVMNDSFVLGHWNCTWANNRGIICFDSKTFLAIWKVGVL